MTNFSLNKIAENSVVAELQRLEIFEKILMLWGAPGEDFDFYIF